MSTFMSRKQGVTQRPPLRRMLSEKDIRTYNRYELKRWRSESTERIVRSLESGQLEPLWVTHDGVVWQGNVRVFVLEERGFPRAGYSIVTVCRRPTQTPIQAARNCTGNGSWKCCLVPTLAIHRSCTPFRYRRKPDSDRVYNRGESR